MIKKPDPSEPSGTVWLKWDRALFRSGIIAAVLLWVPPLIYAFMDHGRWHPEVLRWWLICAPGFAPVMLLQMFDWLPTTLPEGVSWAASVTLSVLVWLFLASLGRKSLAFQILTGAIGLAVGIFAATFAHGLARMP